MFGSNSETLAYGIFCLLGIGNLLPWFVLTNAVLYYQRRFCSEPFEDSFESYYSVAYNVMQPIGLLFTIYLQNRYHHPDQITKNSRSLIFIPLLIYTSLFVINTAIVLAPVVDAKALLVVTIITALLCGGCSAVMNGGLFGLAGMLPPQYTAALMNGQGFAGLLISFISFIVTVSGPRVDTCSDDDGGSGVDDDDNCSDQVDYGDFVYFLIATVILVACVFSFQVLMSLDFVQENLQKKIDEKNEEKRFSSFHGGQQDTKNPLSSPHPNNNSEGMDSPYVLVVKNDQLKPEQLTTVSTVYIFQKIWIPACSVFFVFFLSISLMPSVFAIMQSTKSCSPGSSRWSNDLFIPLIFLLYNIGDFSGRVCAQLTRDNTLFTAQNIWIPTLLRIIPYVLCLFCDINNSRMPFTFNSDAAPIILSVVVGFSNGYFGNIAMMKGPSLAPPELAGRAGTIMVCCLIMGLCIGSALGILNVFIVTGSA
jgi:equilibrative nucleoside transporter 1/2/3